MKFSIQSIAQILAILTPLVSGDAVAPEGSAVVKLNAKNFESFLSENPLVLAEFFAPWCGHCKSLGPEYVQAASSLKDKHIPLAQIDCTQEESLCQSQGIKGYPTLKVFRGAENAKPYEGARKADAISTYMIKQSQPAVIEGVTADSLEKTTGDLLEPVVLQILPKADDKVNTTYHTLANTLRDKYTFMSTDDAALVEKFGVKKPTYVVYRSDFKTGDEPAVYSDDVDSKKLEAFVESESKPYFGEINGETFQDYMNAKIPLAYLFYTTPEERADWASKLVTFGKKYRGKLNFVGLDASRFGKHAENLNQEEKFPLFAIHDLEHNKKYGLDQSKDLDIKSIEGLLTDYESGAAKPIVKSEDIPEVQENAVMKLVAHTHDQVVQDADKDVFVMYHASWCGHCKRLAPTFEEFASIYSSDANASKKVVIANIEATQNDVDVEIEGFPTLVLYPAGDKSHPVNFESSRDLESLAAFVKEHGTHKIDALALKKAQDAKKEEADDDEEEVEHDEL